MGAIEWSHGNLEVCLFKSIHKERVTNPTINIKEYGKTCSSQKLPINTGEIWNNECESLRTDLIQIL